MEIYDLPAHKLAELMHNGEISATELTRAVYSRISDVEQDIQAYVTITEDQAIAAAGALDAQRKAGKSLGPLAGIPVGLKDNICTKGVRTTCSSRILENFTPSYNATIVDKLEAAGGVITGKLNLDEFAMGSSTENSAFFPTRNPWNLSCVPGGSSGGPAAAVAAGEAVYALGSDTGGSLRQPAAYCGIVGMKPTYGLISRNGVVGFASSLDQVGPLTKDVRDCALTLNLIAGHDPLDATSAVLPVTDYTSFLGNKIEGIRIGVPREFFSKDLDSRVADAVKKGIKQLEDLGAHTDECSFPHAEYAHPAYYIIATAEASSNLARFDGVRYGYRSLSKDGGDLDLAAMYLQTRSEALGAEVKRRIMLGTFALSSGYYDAYYLKASKVRTIIRDDFARLFEKFDILVSPTTNAPAFRFGERADDLLTLYRSDLYTTSVNLAGIPALSVPCGFAEGLPVGLQLIGPAFAEGKLLQTAYAFEQSNSYHLARPPLKGRNAETSTKNSPGRE